MLVITQDAAFHEGFKRGANALGYLAVQADGPVGALAILRAVRPAVVVLDLDLPELAAWGTAEVLLQDQSCPPVIPLAEHSGQFRSSTPVGAGTVVLKSDPFARLLQEVEQALQLPERERLERNASQRIFLRWLRPSVWTEQNTPTYRFWGINE